VIGETARINLNHFESAPKTKKLVIVWRVACAVVNELLDDDARLNVLINPFARDLVIAVTQPPTTRF
jgi:hypothetical protein